MKTAHTSSTPVWPQGVRSKESKRLIVRHCGNAHPHMCEYLVKVHGFSDICRRPQDSGLKSKLAHFRDLAVDFFFVLRNLGRIRHAQEIIALGPMAPNLALLLKLRLLPGCRRLFWFGLFVHHPAWLRILRHAFRILDSPKIQYILFSEFEKTLYTKSLSLSEDRLFYVPYGDLADQEACTPSGRAAEHKVTHGDFFFSGGYSNRDYLSLIEVFRLVPARLVIVCSLLNKEIDESALPENITILRELPSAQFDAYVRASKACILPMAHDSGAAGQSVLLRCMKNKKLIIATDTGVIREYIADGVSGILVKDNRESMVTAVLAVNDRDIKSYRECANAAYERYIRYFSGEAIAQRLDAMLNRD